MALPETRSDAEQEALFNNLQFHWNFRNALRRVAPNVQTILDYGSGNAGLVTQSLAALYPEVRITSYDPDMDIEVIERDPRFTDKANLIWTATEPAPTNHDLLLFHFSLHHITNPRNLRQKLTGVAAKYSPAVICIVEYDYAWLDQRAFAATFISPAEKAELEGMFMGDISNAYKFHRQFNKAHYEAALRAAGFLIMEANKGQGAAEPKFFLIAQKNP